MTEQTEREVLEALWKELEPKADERGMRPLSVFRDKVRFNVLLDAGAYLDAAMLLVPEGHQLGIMQEHPDQWRAGMGSWGFDRADHTGEGSTPALALCAAIDAARDAAP